MMSNVEDEQEDKSQGLKVYRRQRTKKKTTTTGGGGGGGRDKQQRPDEKPKLKINNCVVTNPAGLENTVAMSMIEKMGLSRFIFYTEVPMLSRQHCYDFLGSYDPVAGCGKVQDRNDELVSIPLDAELIHTVTGLPNGDTSTAGAFTVDDDGEKILEKLIPTGKKRNDEYDIQDLEYEDDTSTKAFYDIAMCLQEKLMCKTTFKRFATPELLVGLYRALQSDETLPWSGFMASVMRAAVQGGKDLAFGGWLSGMIQTSFEKSNDVPAAHSKPDVSSKRPQKRKKMAYLQQGGAVLPIDQQQQEEEQQKLQKSQSEQQQLLLQQYLRLQELQQQRKLQFTDKDLQLAELQAEMRVSAVEMKHLQAELRKMEKMVAALKDENQKLKTEDAVRQAEYHGLQIELCQRDAREKVMETLQVELQARLAAQEVELSEKRSQAMDVLNLTSNPMEALRECLQNRSEKRKAELDQR